MTKINVEKSKTDHKEYRIIILDNGLKAVIISDLKVEQNNNDDNNSECSDKDDNEGIQKSAAALCINVGSFNDPPELQGLAHYLEHMVFMGSEKYPTENDFDACVSQHGGCSNAWTDAERTLFYFDSHFKQFEGILDKFANFFVSPLLLKSSMDREVTAVNSEFEMGYSNDSQRSEFLLQTLSKCDNPYRIFSCGNTKSLKDYPTSKNIDIYRYLQEFRQNMYSSHWMTLAVQSRDTLDNIETMVKKIFSDIKCNNGTKCDMTKYSNPFDTTDFNKFYKVVPVKDINSLKLTWSLPSICKHYKSKPLHILGHIIGYEGFGSLTAYLRKMNYIVELEGGNSDGGFDSSSFNSFFTVSVRLTDLGFSSVTKVIESIFSFINILKEGIPERIFREYQQTKYNEFLFKEANEPVQNVETLAANLQLYESEHIISGSELVYEYAPQLYVEMLKHLTVDGANFMLISRSFENKTDHITDWYDVKYSVRDLYDDEKYSWNHPSVISELHLPKENKFLASNFDLIGNDEFNSIPVDLSKVVFRDLQVYGELWHQLDNTFKMPKAIVNFYLISTKFHESAINECLTDLIIYALNQQLNIVAYDAAMAGIYYKVTRSGGGILINIDGFNDKLPLLFTTIIDVVYNLEIDEIKISVYKEGLRQIYRNIAIKSSKLAGDVKDKILYSHEWLITEKLSALKDISLNHFVNFHSNFFSGMTIKSYFHGNISKEVAKDCFLYSIDVLKIKPNNTYEKKLLRQLPLGSSNVRVMSLNSNDVNIAVMIDYQLGLGSIKEQAINEFLSHVLTEPCFDYLRTKESLGYSVGIYETKRLGVLGLNLYVMGQVDKFCLDHCNLKIHNFFEIQSKELLMNMSEEDFREYKDSFVANKLIEDIQMSDVESRNWKEIITEEYVFDRRFKHVEYIEEVMKGDLIDFLLVKYLSPEFQRKLIVEVDAKAKNELLQNSVDESLYEMNLEFLGDNCMAFVDLINEKSFYPSHKIKQ